MDRRVVERLRGLRARGAGRRRPGKAPRPAHPTALQLEYWKALMPVVEDARAAFAYAEQELVRGLEDLRREQSRGARQDADSSDRAQRLVHAAAARAASMFRPRDVERVAAEFGRRAEDHARRQLDRQVRHALGVPLGAIERPTRDRIPLFASSSVELVKSVPDRYFDRLARDVREAYASGAHPETLARQLVDDYGAAEEDARRLARDQIGKLNGLVQQDRQESLGVTSFVWRTVHDERVRESHADLDGEVFPWDDLPTDEQTGEEVSPGSAIQCRCWAEPVFDDLLPDQASE